MYGLSNEAIISFRDGLSPVPIQAIISTNAAILIICPGETNCIDFAIEIEQFAFRNSI